LIFKCALLPGEVVAMQKHLPADEFCIINNPEEKINYGIMNDELHARFMDILSGETLECLEYLDVGEFRKLGEIERWEVIGNARLMDRLLL
jgi:hypothetical protein